MGNGDEQSGDGWKFLGRGFIQLTGKYNVEAYAKSRNKKVDEAVEYLKTVEGACDSAVWFWKDRSCGALSSNIEALTKKINGGLNGLDHRKKLFEM